MKTYADFSSDGLKVGFFREDVYPPVQIFGPDPANPQGNIVIRTDRNPLIPTSAVEVSEATYQDWINNPNVRRWNSSAGQIEIAVPPTVELIYDSASKLGLKRALSEIGKWDALKAALAANPEAQDEWDLAVSIKKTDPLTQAIIAALSLTEAQVTSIIQRANELV